MSNKLPIVAESFMQKWIGVLKTLGVEPASFLFMLIALVNYLTTTELMLERICTVNLGFDPTNCRAVVTKTANGSFPEMEVEIQKVALQATMYKSWIDKSMPIVFLLFFAPWADVIRRKYLLLAVSFSYVTMSVLMIMAATVKSVDGIWVAILQAIGNNHLGGSTVFIMASNAYIADTYGDEMRTFRAGVLSAFYSSGVAGGLFLGGRLRKSQVSIEISYGISFILSLVTFFIVLLRVKSKKVTKANSNNKDGKPKSYEEKPEKTCCVKPDFFGVIKLLCKKRENNSRVELWLLLIGLTFIFAPFHGEFGVLYLFVRSRIGWSTGDYGMFATVNSLIAIVGVLLSVSFFCRFLKLSDPTVGFISGISQISSCFIYAFASSSAMMYLGTAVDLMNGTMVVVAKSMMSKIVQPHEIGKLFSLLAVIELVTPLIMTTTYIMVYRYTMTIFVGTVFVLSAVLTIPPQLIYGWFMWQNKSKNSVVNNPESRTSEISPSKEKSEYSQVDSFIQTPKITVETPLTESID